MSSSTTPPTVSPPDYSDGFPEMSDDLFKSTTGFDLGWLSGLHETASNSIDKLFGTYKFNLNPDDLLDLEDLDVDTFTSDSSGPIIYISIWGVLAILFTLGGLIWCCSNKCICCCRNGFKGRKTRPGGDDDGMHLHPYYSERNDKKYGRPSVGAIIVAACMAIWLLGLLLVTLYAFGGNKEINKAVDNLQGDLTNGIDDLQTYIQKTVEQLDHLFVKGFGKFKPKINEIIAECIKEAGENPVVDFCSELDNIINTGDEAPMFVTEKELNSSMATLNDALNSVDKTIEDAKTNIDDNYEDIIADSTNGLYWFFMLFNLLYCLVFALVLIGTVLAVAGQSSGMKTAGFLTTRVAIVLMFIMTIFVVIQFIIMFSFGGVLTEIFCPAIRRLEDENTINAGGDIEVKQSFDGYEVPTYGEIMRSCNKDESAYKAFRLEKAFNIKELQEITKTFNDIDLTIPTLPTNAPTPPPDTEVPDPAPALKALEDIRTQVNRYVDTIINTVENEVGKCQPAYKAINATVSIFCNKLPAPMISFWYVLQFIPPLFLVMIITAFVLERISS